MLFVVTCKYIIFIAMNIRYERKTSLQNLLPNGVYSVRSWSLQLRAWIEAFCLHTSRRGLTLKTGIWVNLPLSFSKKKKNVCKLL